MATDQLSYSSDSSSSVDARDIIERNVDSDLSDLSQPASVHDLETEMSRLLDDYESSGSEHEDGPSHNSTLPENVADKQTVAQSTICALQENTQVEIQAGLEYRTRSVRRAGVIGSPPLTKCTTKPAPLTIHSGQVEHYDIMTPTPPTSAVPLSAPPLIKNLAIQRLLSNQSLKSAGSSGESLQGTPSASSSQLYYDSDAEHTPKPLAEELEEAEAESAENQENQPLTNGDSIMFIESEESSSSSEFYSSEDESEDVEFESGEQWSSEEIDFELHEGGTPSPQAVSPGRGDQLVSPLLAALQSRHQNKTNSVSEADSKPPVGYRDAGKDAMSLSPLHETSTKVDTTSNREGTASLETEPQISEESTQDTTVNEQQNQEISKSTESASTLVTMSSQLCTSQASSARNSKSSRSEDAKHLYHQTTNKLPESVPQQMVTSITKLDNNAQFNEAKVKETQSPIAPASKLRRYSEASFFDAKYKPRLVSDSVTGTQEQAGRFRVPNKGLSPVRKFSTPVKRFYPPEKPATSPYRREVNTRDDNSRVTAVSEAEKRGQTRSSCREDVKQDLEGISGQKPPEKDVLKLKDLTHTESGESIISGVSEVMAPTTESPTVQGSSHGENLSEKHLLQTSEHNRDGRAHIPKLLIHVSDKTQTSTEPSYANPYVSHVKQEASHTTPNAVNSPRLPLKGILKKNSRFSRSSTSSDTDITTVTPLGSDTSLSNSEDDAFKKPVVESTLRVSSLSTVSSPPPPSTAEEHHFHSHDDSLSLSQQMVAKMRESESESSATSSEDDDHEPDRTLTEELAAAASPRVHNSGHQPGSEATLETLPQRNRNTENDLLQGKGNESLMHHADKQLLQPRATSSPITAHYPLEHATARSEPPEQNSQQISLTLSSNDKEDDGLPMHMLCPMENTTHPQGKATNEVRLYIHSTVARGLCVCVCVCL